MVEGTLYKIGEISYQTIRLERHGPVGWLIFNRRDAELRFTAWHNQVWKPVIAAVNGVCAGGGLHFVADADVVLLSENATLLDPHVSVGQVSAYETIGLIRKSPAEAILRMALMGRYERI